MRNSDILVSGMALILLAAYLIGSVPFALLLARRWGADDLRRIGSGNVGAANALRASGISAGVLVAVLDIAKGAASVALAMRLSGDARMPAAAGFAAIVGHMYPIWLWFKGGKGVATACGVFSVLAATVPPALLIFWRQRKNLDISRLIDSRDVALPIAYATGY